MSRDTHEKCGSTARFSCFACPHWIKVINLKYKIKVQLKDNVRRMPKCNTHIDINKIMIKTKLGFYIIFFSFPFSSIPNKNIKHNETL